MNQQTVVIESGKNRDKSDLLETALQKCRFKEILESALKKSGKSKSEFFIMIKPNLAMFFKGSVTVTDPELVEDLVDWMNNYGFTNVALGEATNIFSKWLENREIHNIAEKAGYKVIDVNNFDPFFRCKTTKGREYKFFDLHADATKCELPKIYSLYGISISKNWQNADFRISFAKNKTHEEYVYTLCLKNLLGAISKEDKHRHYHSRLQVKDVCFELYKFYPIHFNIIDAYNSSHGNTGAQVANKIQTETIIAGENTILVDWVGALKMGIDPYLSPLNRKALEYEGLPKNYKIMGSLKPYVNWKTVHPLIYDGLLRLDKNAVARDFLWPATFKNNDKLFPWKNKIPKYVNKILSPFWEWTDKSSIIRWVFTFSLYFLVFLTFISTVFKKNFFKKGLMIKELPINLFNKNSYSKDDFDGLSDYIKPLEEIIDSLTKKNGTCHTFIDEGILYYLERYVDVEFEDFVNSMKIRNAVSTMKDYIGGRSVCVESFENEKTEFRVERTVYLPQPNLLAFLNAKDIDVTKIERTEKGRDFHKILWKTVLSDNESALFDDGAVTFKKDCCRTEIKIMVHQAFQLPKLVLMALRFTGLRKLVTLWIYHFYFKNTVANYRKNAEQKYTAIGKHWIPDKEFLRQVTP